MAASTKQPFEVVGFQGGITDEVFSGDTSTAFQLDNFFITSDKKLLSRPGSTLDDADHSPIPAGNQRIGALINYARNDKLFVQSATKFYYRPAATGAWQTLTGPSGNDVLSAGSTANFIARGEWNKQLLVVSDAWAAPMRVYKDGSNVYQVRNLGLPQLASNPTITPSTAGTNSYVYAFVYNYTYTVQSKSFLDIGPTRWVTVTLSSDPGTHSNAITAIPVLTNSGGNNYDTTNIKVEIYRTINGGVNFYRVGEVLNGTTTFTDSVSDANLQTNAQLYTNDGTLDYYPAPTAKYLHIVGNMGFYGYTKDTDGEHPYRLHQSVPGNPGFVPQITWVEVEDEVKGVGSVKGLPMLFCKRIIYRIDGLYDEQGRGGMNPIEVHHSAGCVSHASIVEAENYVFWAGNDGFYASDGYVVFKVSDHLNTRYANLLASTTNAARIQGVFDETNRRVYWCVEQSSSNLENDSIFALDLRWGVTPKSSFTTASGNSFRPTALEMFNGYLYRGDNNGFVFKHDPSVLTDPKVNTSLASNQWARETVLWTYTSNQYNFGSSFFRKFVSRILLQAGSNGNTTIQITASNDQGKKIRNLKIIRWRRNFIWGDSEFVWGNTDCIWQSEGLIEQWRRFPAGGLRLSYLQVTIKNGFGIVANSDTDGLATLTRSSKQLVIASGQWPADSVDYQITFAVDGYTRYYTVSAINGGLDTLTLLDPNNTLPVNGTYAWELYGYKKDEALNLLGYNLHWDNVDQNQNTYGAGDDGAN